MNHVPIAWDCANDAYRERAYNAMAEELAILREAVRYVKDLRPTAIADTGFTVGPQALLNAAQRQAKKAIAACRKIQKRASVGAGTGLEAAKVVEDYLNLRLKDLDAGDAANIVHLLNEHGFLKTTTPKAGE